MNQRQSSSDSPTRENSKESGSRKESESDSPKHHPCWLDQRPQLYTQTQYLLAVSGKLELRFAFLSELFIPNMLF